MKTHTALQQYRIAVHKIKVAVPLRTKSMQRGERSAHEVRRLVWLAGDDLLVEVGDELPRECAKVEIKDQEGDGRLKRSRVVKSCAG